MEKNLDLRSPSRFKQVLESIGVREITSADICPNQDVLDGLYRKHPDLLGDRTAIGPGDDGCCQWWRGYTYWWRRFIRKNSN